MKVKRPINLYKVTIPLTNSKTPIIYSAEEVNIINDKYSICLEDKALIFDDLVENIIKPLTNRTAEYIRAKKPLLKKSMIKNNP